MAFVVRIHEKTPTGPKRGEFGPFPTQATAKRQAQVIADELVAPGHVVTVEKVGGTRKAKTRTKTRARRKNPGCKDAGGRFVPTPGCRGQASPMPTKTIKVKVTVDGKSKDLTYTLDATSGTKAIADAHAKKLRAQGYKARVVAFPMGIGIYRRGRKKAATKTKAKSATRKRAVRRNSSDVEHRGQLTVNELKLRNTRDPVERAYLEGKIAAHRESRTPQAERVAAAYSTSRSRDWTSKLAKKRNPKAYPYYVVDIRRNVIVSGWDYREDAKDFIVDHEDHPGLRVYGKAKVKQLGATWGNLAPRDDIAAKYLPASGPIPRTRVSVSAVSTRTGARRKLKY